MAQPSEDEDCHTTVMAIYERSKTLRKALIDHQRDAEACRDAISHIDFVLAHCSSKSQHRKIARRFTTHTRRLPRGHITRMVMTVLRRADRPISAREILGL